jgi:Zn-finger nucleic acid-binding protein
MSDRQGVEIDYCPQCRGVWLDRGELDKIIERATAAVPAPGPAVMPPPIPQGGGYEQPRRRRDDDDYDDDDDDYRRKHRTYGGSSGVPPQKKKKSFLGDLFDF